MVPAGFDVAFLDHPQEILVLSCVLRLVGGTEGALRLSGVTAGLCRSRAAVSPCIWPIAPSDVFLAKKPRESSNPTN